MTFLQRHLAIKKTRVEVEARKTSLITGFSAVSDAELLRNTGTYKLLTSKSQARSIISSSGKTL